jgi:hypothetical protein
MEAARSAVLVVLVFLRGALGYALVSAGCVTLYEHLVDYQGLVAREGGDKAT